MGRLIFIISVILLFQAISLGQDNEKYIPPPPPIRDPDWLHQNRILNWNDEKLRLLNYVKELNEQKNSTLYLIIQAQNPKEKKIRIRRQKIEYFLTKVQKIDKDRFKIIAAKSKVERTEYWIVPKGANPPND